MAEHTSSSAATRSGNNQSGASSQRTLSVDEQPREKQRPKGCVAGGKYLDNIQEGNLDGTEDRRLEKVELDLPLTYTTFEEHEGKDLIILEFAPGDKENPFNWPLPKKRFITALLCLMTLFIGLATTAYSSGISSMCDDFGVDTILGQVGLFTFNFTCAIAPLFLAPFCELAGRRVVYTGAYAAFTVMFIGLALGKNIGTILVCRALLGLFGCVGTILVGGTFSDMYIPAERARPMALFSYVAILGTVAAPIYAGFINMTIGWRWIEGIQGLSNIPLLFLVCIFLTETRGDVTLHRRARALRDATGNDSYISRLELQTSGVKDMLHESCVKAVHMLITEPVVLGFGLWIAFAWFLVFLFLSVIPITFEEKRGWNEGVAGLPYVSLCIGTTLGYFCNQFQMRKHEQITKDPNRKVLPEDRLYGAMFGGIFLPIGLFIYSFTQYGYLPWIAPTIALAPIAFGIFFIFESVYSVTSDCYGAHASSAIAGQGFLRNTLGAVSPLFATQFFHNVGSQFAGLILALVATILTVLPFVMFKYGHVLRSRSKLAQKF